MARYRADCGYAKFGSKVWTTTFSGSSRPSKYDAVLCSIQKDEPFTNVYFYLFVKFFIFGCFQNNERITCHVANNMYKISL